MTTLIVGIDEVGRGCLSGQCWAAAVAFPANQCIEGLKDSKALSEKKRLELDASIRRNGLVGLGFATVAEIDHLNILRAALLAMTRAFAALPTGDYRILVDGNHCPDFGGVPAEAIIKGDALHPQISAASIIAKVARDAEMESLHRQYPVYGWAKNKGYGTPDHLDALRVHGPTPHHRMSFAPLREPALPF